MSGNQLMTILSPVIGTIFTVFYLLLWSQHRTRTYILYFSVSFSCYTLAASAKIVLPSTDSGQNIVPSIILFVLCIILLSKGCLHRRRKTLNYIQILAVLIPTVISFIYYYYIDKNLSARIYILSFGCGLLFATTAYRLRPSREDRLVDKIIFWIFLLLSLQLILRPMLTFRPQNMDEGTFGDSTFWLALNFSLIVSAVLMGLALLFAIVVDITSDLKRQSATDVLTGAYNRRGFDEKATAIIANGKFHPLSLVVCDIDHFKSINDDNGHSAGDQVLTKFAALLNAHVRKNDIVGRIGGEEFTVLLTQCGLSDAIKFSERIRVLFEASGTEGLRGNSKTTASFGIADHRSGETLQQLVNRADRLLYAAKNSGRNRVCSEEAMPIVLPRREIVHALNNKLPSP